MNARSKLVYTPTEVVFVAAVNGGWLLGVAGRVIGCGNPDRPVTVGVGTPANGRVGLHKRLDVKLEVTLGHLPRHHTLYHFLEVT